MVKTGHGYRLFDEYAAFRHNTLRVLVCVRLFSLSEDRTLSSTWTEPLKEISVLFLHCSMNFYCDSAGNKSDVIHGYIKRGIKERYFAEVHEASYWTYI